MARRSSLALWLLLLAGAGGLYLLARRARSSGASSDLLEALTVTVQKIGSSIGSALSSGLDQAKRLIAGEEGLRLEVYRDPGAGAWTIGYGHLVKPGERFYPYGSVKTITREEAEALFAADLAQARSTVQLYVRAPINDNQRAALESLVFNIGRGAFVSSTLLARLNVGDYAGAAAEFGRWIYDDGKIVAGLRDRRERERQIFLA